MQHHLKHEYPCYPTIEEKFLSKKFHYIVMPELEDGFNQPAYDYQDYFNISHPFYMFERYDNYFDLYVYALEKGSVASVNTYFNNIPMLENFKFYFKEKARKLIENSKKNKIIIPKHMQANFGGLQKNNDLCKKESISFLPKKYFFESKDEVFWFTSRQMEVLTYLGRGFTAKQIAKKLTLSVRTIESYINDIKLKLDIKNKSDLISYCYDLGVF